MSDRDPEDALLDFDPEDTLLDAAIADMPVEVDAAFVRAEIRAAIARIKAERGPRGPRGPAGPMGQMPRHEWDGAKLRFEIEPGVWGEWADLRGPAGKEGKTIYIGGGGTSAPASSYFPGGW